MQVVEEPSGHGSCADQRDKRSSFQTISIYKPKVLFGSFLKQNRDVIRKPLRTDPYPVIQSLLHAFQANHVKPRGVESTGVQERQDKEQKGTIERESSKDEKDKTLEDLIDQIKLSINEIGFNNTESFSKAFYRKTGIYPSYFIKEIEKQQF